MTNKEIIMMQTAILIEDGTIAEDAIINTWAGWQARGFRVKRGEHHIAEFSIWVKNKNKPRPEAEESEEEQERPKKKRRDFLLQSAYWFTNEQVEPIT